MIIRLLSLSLATALLSGVVSADEPKPAEKPPLQIQSGTPRLAIHIDSEERDFGPIVRSTSLLGRRVADKTGQMVGVVENIAIDLDEGRCSLLIVRPLDGKPSRTAIPWSIVNTDEKVIRVDATRKHLNTAPTLTKTDLIKTKNRLWGATIYEFFEVEPYWSDRAGVSAWGVDSPFVKPVSMKNLSTISGVVDRTESVRPSPGATPAVHLVVKTNIGERTVHIGPLSFLSRRDFGFHRGEKITVQVAQVEDHLIAVSLKTPVDELKLRNEDGEVAWRGWSSEDEEYGFSLLTNLQGKSVVDSDGKSAGKVLDFAMLQRDGRIFYAAVRISPTGSKLHAIPLGAFVASPGADQWLLNVDKKILSNTPSFTANQWPTEIERAWVEYLHVRYGKPLFSGVTTPSEQPPQEDSPQ